MVYSYHNIWTLKKIYEFLFFIGAYYERIWRGLDSHPLFAATHSLHFQKSKEIHTWTLYSIKSCLLPKKLFVIVMQYLNHFVQSLRPISHVYRNHSLISHYKRDKMVVVVIDVFIFGQLTLAIAVEYLRIWLFTMYEDISPLIIHGWMIKTPNS